LRKIHFVSNELNNVLILTLKSLLWTASILSQHAFFCSPNRNHKSCLQGRNAVIRSKPATRGGNRAIATPEIFKSMFSC